MDLDGKSGALMRTAFTMDQVAKSAGLMGSVYTMARAGRLVGLTASDGTTVQGDSSDASMGTVSLTGLGAR